MPSLHGFLSSYFRRPWLPLSAMGSRPHSASLSLDSLQLLLSRSCISETFDRVKANPAPSKMLTFEKHLEKILASRKTSFTLARRGVYEWRQSCQDEDCSMTLQSLGSLREHFVTKWKEMLPQSRISGETVFQPMTMIPPSRSSPVLRSPPQRTEPARHRLPT